MKINNVFAVPYKIKYLSILQSSVYISNSFSRLIFTEWLEECLVSTYVIKYRKRKDKKINNDLISEVVQNIVAFREFKSNLFTV